MSQTWCHFKTIDNMKHCMLQLFYRLSDISLIYVHESLYFELDMTTTWRIVNGIFYIRAIWTNDDWLDMNIIPIWLAYSVNDVTSPFQYRSIWMWSTKMILLSVHCCYIFVWVTIWIKSHTFSKKHALLYIFKPCLIIL